MKIDYSCGKVINSRARSIFTVTTTPEGFNNLKDITVILTPGFGKTFRNNLSCALYLNWNNIRVIRYDNTNHVGKSDGDISNFDFEEAKDNINAVYNEFYDASRSTVLVTPDIMLRAAIRAGAENGKIKEITGLDGFVNLERAFFDTNDDLYKDIGNYAKTDFSELAANYEESRIKKQPVSADFIFSVIKNGYMDINSTCADARKVNAKIINIIPGDSKQIKIEDNRQILSVTEGGEVYIVPGAENELSANPQTAKIAFRQIVRCILQDGCHKVKMPTILDIIRYNKYERELELR